MKTLSTNEKTLTEENIFSTESYNSVLFDLDGVITRTARIHSACWKKTFDQFLSARVSEGEKPFAPFSETEDYLIHVDGKPRYEGVRSFLFSRGIELPQGREDSPAGEHSVFGLGKRKNDLFLQTLKKERPDIYKTSVELARSLKKTGIGLAVVSSSRNCRAVMKSAGIDNLFEVVIDGVFASEMGLLGKPEPDTFLAAMEALGSSPQLSVVIEDSAAGVEAGKHGGFGLVIGVARNNNSQELLQSGAHIVVRDLSELRFE